MIIAIEGPDFVGKNTLVKHLATLSKKFFPNHDISILQFPNTETEIGKICRERLLSIDWSYSDGVIFQLLNTAHRYEYYDQLKDARKNGSNLLFVIRYNLSGPVYASIDGLNATKTWNLYSWFDDLLPDMTFIIEREYDFEDLRNARTPDHYENESKQSKVRQIYHAAEVLWGDKLGQVEYIKNIDPEITMKKMLEILKKKISANQTDKKNK
ncbi:MAG: dTMP kinase [Candidatus Hodarchaeales archaeon]